MSLATLLECPSEFEFPSAAVGVTCRMQCELRRGHEGPHKCMFHGRYPHEWTNEQAVETDDQEQPDPTEVDGVD